jgi:toxin-antitoxin system PIN domain toxin
MKPALLDTNVLLALTWPNHQHHAEAHKWFSAQSGYGWATCAVTQLGFIRLSANPAYTPAPVSPPEAASLLERLLRHKSHRFWPSPSAATPGIYSRTLGHQQINDAYLVELARHQRGRFVTFDTRAAAHDNDIVHVISG